MTRDIIDYVVIRALHIAQPTMLGLEPCERCGVFIPVDSNCRCDLPPETVAAVGRALIPSAKDDRR